MPSYISSIGIAVPKNRISQDKILGFMLQHLPLEEGEKNALKVLCRASGIATRHSVIADYEGNTDRYSFFPQNESLEPFPDVDSRMKLYENESIILAEEASFDCLKNKKVAPSDITHLITVSCTGMYAPGLDIDLVSRLGLSTDVQRTAVNFMGCYAAFNALKIAHHISSSNPKAKVLVVCVELCSIHFQKTNDEDNLLSSTLFGDGAAAVLLTGENSGQKCFEMQSFYSDLDMSAKLDMSWKIGNLGFLMKLSPKVPETIQNGIKNLTQKLLGQIGLGLDAIDFFVIHPGGKRILEVIEMELGISKMDNLLAYEVLKNYGNMSSPTVLFVLKSLMDQLEIKDNNKNILSFAFGPGLTMESMLLKTHIS